MLDSSRFPAGYTPKPMYAKFQVSTTFGSTNFNTPVCQYGRPFNVM